MNLKDMDNSVPGGVYLCQVKEQVSCGACCGLYNVADISRHALESMLSFRTEAFRSVARNMQAILDFKEGIEERESGERPFQKFHHCPYIGLIGENNSCVGCLLHPLAEGNHGVDFRGLSYYGGMACNVYFCSTCRNLPPAFKKIVREICDDWYLYGLMITETTLLTALFAEVQKRLDMPLCEETIVEDEKRRKVLRQILKLKLDWPFRRSGGNRLCHYFFEDRQYSRSPIGYDALGAAISRHDIIFRELCSEFDSRDTLRQAEKMLDDLFDQLL